MGSSAVDKSRKYEEEALGNDTDEEVLGGALVVFLLAIPVSSVRDYWRSSRRS